MRTIGIEREWFILKDGKIVPMIGELLEEIRKQTNNNSFNEDFDQFGFELFAGQVEDRTRISDSINGAIISLSENKEILINSCKNLGLEVVCKEFVTEQELGGLVVNPISERHQEIWKNLPKERKVAASQVAAIHVHIQVTEDEAVNVLNFCRKDVVDRLVEIGDSSEKRRIDAYRMMAKKNGDPPTFEDYKGLKKYIEESGGERDVWDLIRYKPSTNTLEFRMFGSTEDDEKIREFIEVSYDIVEKAQKSGRS